jgi:lipopolysaccharide/colanic/teichoic acid biosynthesis glycosyltransferase
MKTETITVKQNGAPYSISKEVFDRTAAAIGLLVLMPVFGIIAILIKLDSRGPVFFKHKRVGRFGELFQMYKFRTMVQNADKIGPGLTSPGDARITRLGKFLRRTSLDELPQLINVLRGEMSIVGPRPEIPQIVQTYSEQQLRALLVKPGITGLSQINGRDDLPLDIKLAFEVTYVEQFSLKQDLKILLKTFPVLISGKGNRY